MASKVSEEEATRIVESYKRLRYVSKVCREVGRSSQTVSWIVRSHIPKQKEQPSCSFNFQILLNGIEIEMNSQEDFDGVRSLIDLLERQKG